MKKSELMSQFHELFETAKYQAPFCADYLYLFNKLDSFIQEVDELEDFPFFKDFLVNLAGSISTVQYASHENVQPHDNACPVLPMDEFPFDYDLFHKIHPETVSNE